MECKCTIKKKSGFSGNPPNEYFGAFSCKTLSATLYTLINDWNIKNQYLAVAVFLHIYSKYETIKRNYLLLL